jgi:hypothetical protein
MENRLVEETIGDYRKQKTDAEGEAGATKSNERKTTEENRK